MDTNITNGVRMRVNESIHHLLAIRKNAGL